LSNEIEAEWAIWVDHFQIVIDIDESRLGSIAQLQAFLEGAGSASLPSPMIKSAMRTLPTWCRLGYARLPKPTDRAYVIWRAPAAIARN
jgi:hypothetical protein